MNKFIWRGWILPLTFFNIVLVGCNAHPSNSQVSEPPNQKIVARSAAVGQDEERHGTMSSADYLHWEEVGNKVSAERRIDDNDLDWAISMMHKPSTEPAEVHEMMMGLFLTARTLEPAQKKKIRAAVTPLLTSSNPVEVKAANHVLKKL